MMNRLLRAFAGAAGASVLCGCNPAPTALVYYDACARESASFVTVAACGKKTRNQKCEEMHSCSALGNASVEYADALSESVQHKEISDAEARQRWAKFKIEQINHMQNLEMQQEAFIAASTPAPPVTRPVNCTGMGTGFTYSMTCY